MNALLGVGSGRAGPSNARPPYTPVPFAPSPGRHRAALLDPVRTTPMHAWHVAHGAAFEDVGQWKRPWFLPARRRGRWTPRSRASAAAVRERGRR